MTLIVNSYLLLAALQRFIDRRGMVLDRLTATSMLALMTDWYRDEPIHSVDHTVSADVLVYRYGGWSEGCVTGFKLSLLRRVTDSRANDGKTDWFAGITMLFDPNRYTAVEPFSVVSSEQPSLDAFIHAIEDSSAFKLSAPATAMGSLLESGGIR